MKMLLTLFIIVMPLASAIAIYAQNSISQSVVASGGTTLTNNELRMTATVGQPVIGITSTTSYIVQSGFWYGLGDLITSVEQVSEDVLPREFQLQQNYPNPFNPSTTILFAVPQPSRVTVKVYDIRGREVTTLAEDDFHSGEYKIVFEASRLPSGIYFYRMQADDFSQIRKLTLLK